MVYREPSVGGGGEFSLFVGDLSPEINDTVLFVRDHSLSLKFIDPVRFNPNMPMFF
jgi:hypothetical protein